MLSGGVVIVWLGTVGSLPISITPHDAALWMHTSELRIQNGDVTRIQMKAAIPFPDEDCCLRVHLDHDSSLHNIQLIIL